MRMDVASRTDEIAAARGAVASFLVAHRVSSSLVDDMQLVTSELVTNAVLHGRPGPIAVELNVDGDICLRVTNEGPVSLVPPVGDWRVADPPQRSGRGLGLVRRLSDDVDVGGDADRSIVTVRRRLPDGGGDR